MSRVRPPAQQRNLEGMTLIEVTIVVLIIALAGSGLSLSLGALTRTTLKSAAGKLASAARYAYNRAIINGTTVRIVFDVPGGSFSVEEASGRVTLARADDERRAASGDDEGNETVAADPWEAAKARIANAQEPNLGGSPFHPLKGTDGSALKRYAEVPLGRRIQIVRLIVPHHPHPVDDGKGAVHFFPGGLTEHAVIQLSDGRDDVYSVEIHPLTGRAKIHDGAYEPEVLLGDPDDPDATEVDE